MTAPMSLGAILADLHTDLADACETCMPVTADRAYYTATPHRVEHTADGGTLAHYAHGCGARWTTAWKD